MASTFRPFIQALDDVIDVMKRNGHEGGPNMRALFAKHKARHRDVVDRLKAQDADAADVARTASKGKVADPLKEMKTARRQDAAYNVAMTRDDADLAKLFKKYKLDPDSKDIPKELGAVIRDKLRSKLGSADGFKDLGIAEAKTAAVELVAGDLAETLRLDTDLPAPGTEGYGRLSAKEKEESQAVADLKTMIDKAASGVVGETTDIVRGK